MKKEATVFIHRTELTFIPFLLLKKVVREEKAYITLLQATEKNVLINKCIYCLAEESKAYQEGKI